MMNLVKGIIVGVSSVVPGFSGSVLLVILGLYENIIEAISTLHKNLKKNIIFLVPIFLGFAIGIVLFSNVIEYLLNNFEMQTRYAFLGLVIGTIPLFRKEVIKNGWDNKYYLPMGIAFAVGMSLVIFHNQLFPPVITPNLFQCIKLGFIVAVSMIIPGIASATVLSTFGLYELYVSSVANLDMSVLIPAGIGAVVGVLVVAKIINKLIKKYYTITFAVLFGLFISIIPSVLNESCVPTWDLQFMIAIVMFFLGLLTSYGLGKLKN